MKESSPCLVSTSGARSRGRFLHRGEVPQPCLLTSSSCEKNSKSTEINVSADGWRPKPVAVPKTELIYRRRLICCS